MVRLLSEDFAELDANRTDEETLKRLIGRLNSIDRVPHSAREAVSKVLHEQFQRYAERELMWQERPLASHILDALMNLGYPWALQVDPEVAATFQQKVAATEANARRGSLARLGAVVVLSLAAIAVALMLVFQARPDVLPEWVGSVLLWFLNL